MEYEESIKKRDSVSFPLPSLISSIEELLMEVRWLDGVILITDSQIATFVSFSQIDPLMERLRLHPKGKSVSKLLGMSLLESFGLGITKPVLVLKNDGTFWLGLMGISGNHSQSNNLVAHLNRCFNLST